MRSDSPKSVDAETYDPVCETCSEIIDKNEGYTVSGDGRTWWCHEHEPQEERAIL